MSEETGSDNGLSEEDVLRMQVGQVEIPDELPLIGIENFVLFPFMIAPLVVTQDHNKQLVDDVLKGDRLIGAVLKKETDKPDTPDNLHDVGVLAVVLKMLRMPDGAVRLLLHGLERIEIGEVVATEPYLRVKAEELAVDPKPTRAVLAMTKQIQALLMKLVENGQLPQDFGAAVVTMMDDPGKLADLAVSHLSVGIEERQEVLALPDLKERLERVLEITSREVSLLQLGSEIQTKVTDQMSRNQREYMLREQLKAIRTELGEDGTESPDLLELADRIKKAKLPDYVRTTAKKELGRLEMMHPSSPEYTVSRNYLDWILDLPWKKRTRDRIDLRKARTVLDEDHYALEDVKERILEHLAVIQLKKEVRGPILCFVGPPGVGKTSLGRSIARALGRKFYRMSLGGMRDEAEIRGHRRTYIGALPGRLIKGIKDCGSNNPLIMLDEIDKIGADFRGDPASALLEVLDPEQNHSFTDHYLDMPFDLSSVMFITTANQLDPVPGPLLDRMEVLRLSGYTAREKKEIAKRYLVPRGYENTGVSEDQVRFTDAGIIEIIESYTREAGVRNLEREIGTICRKVAKTIALDICEPIEATPEEVRRLLGPRRVFHEMAEKANQPGIAAGLAWTPSGGEVLFVEVISVPGSGQLLLTGQLGDVMKESAMAAMNLLHANAEKLDLSERAFSEFNFHLHVPAGATPKDGPSAGITMATALCSLLTDCPVKKGLTMTGEVTIKGTVLPVGGLKEKMLAAHRAGLTEVILPARSKDEIEKDVPREVRDAMRFHYVDHIAEVLKIAFPELPETEAKPEAKPEPRPRDTRRESTPTPEPARSTDTVVLPTQGQPTGKRPPLRIEPEAPRKRSRRHRRKPSDHAQHDKAAKDTTPAEKPAADQTPVAASSSTDSTPTPPSPSSESSTEPTKKPRRRRRGRRGGARARAAAERAARTDEAPNGKEKETEPESKPEATEPTPPAPEKAPTEKPRRERPRRSRRRRTEQPIARDPAESPTPPTNDATAPAAPQPSTAPKPAAPPEAPKAAEPVAPAEEKTPPQKRATRKKTVAKKTTARKATTATKKTTKKTAAKKVAKTAAKRTTKTAAKKVAKKAVKKTAKKTAKRTVKKAVKKTVRKTPPTAKKDFDK